MTPEEKRLIKLLESYCNDKIKLPSQIMNDHALTDIERFFWKGQYQAFSEMYTMLQNLKRIL